MQLPTGQKAAPTLRRVMRAREYFALAFGSMVGVGWMIVLDDWLARGGSLGAMLGFLIGGIAVIPIVYAYGRLAEQMPESASEIAYTGAVFPRSVSFATGWAMALAYVIVCPYEAVAIGRIASYAVPELNTLELYRVADYPVYLPHLVLGIGTTLAIWLINYRGVGPSTLLQNLTTYGLLLIFGVFATLGLWRGSMDNLRPFFAREQEALGSVVSVLMVLQIVPYFLQGFETVPKCSEEASSDFAPGRFVRVMFWALAVATLFYITVIGVVALLQPWRTLLGVEFPTAAAFEQAFGWPWLVQLIMFGVVLSLLKVYNGTFLAVTRLLYAMGRRELLGGRLGVVHPRYQTPVVAIALVGSLAILGTFLGRAVLVPISEVGSVACSACWLATSLAYSLGAGGNRTPEARVVGICGALVAGMLIVIAASGFGVYHWVALAAWTALGLGLWFMKSTSNGGKAEAHLQTAASSAEELIDIVDEEGRVIGTVPRREMRGRRLPHRCVYILVFNRQGELFVHLRTPTKDVYPSHWDVTVGGVLTAGESFETAARRELREELGVEAEPESLFLFRYSDAATIVQGMVYRLVHGGPFRLQPEEIVRGEFVHPDAVAARAARGPFCPDGLAVLAEYRRRQVG